MDPTWGSFAGGYYGDHSYDMSDEEVASRYITFDVDLISVIPEGFDPFLYHYLHEIHI